MERTRSLSALLRTLPEDGEGPMSFEQLAAHFGRRSMGALLFVFSVPNIFPMPPGVSVVLGFPLLVIAPQLAFGAHTLWVPARVKRMTFQRATLTALSVKAAPWVERAERLTRRRWHFMFSHVGDIVMGLICTLLAFILILPIPLGNVLPGLAVAALSLSLVQRDGVLALLGYGLTATSLGVLLLSGKLLMIGIENFGAMTGLW